MNQRRWLINSIKPTARQVPPIVRCAWFTVWLSASRRFVGRVSLFNPNTQQVVKTKPPAVWLAVACDAQFAINHLHCLIRRSRPIPAFGVCCKLPFRFAGRQSITVRSPYDHRTITVRPPCDHRAPYLDLSSELRLPSISFGCCKDYRCELKTRVDDAFICLHSNSSLIYLCLSLNESFILVFLSLSLWAGAKQSGVCRLFALSNCWQRRRSSTTMETDWVCKLISRRSASIRTSRLRWLNDDRSLSAYGVPQAILSRPLSVSCRLRTPHRASFADRTKMRFQRLIEIHGDSWRFSIREFVHRARWKNFVRLWTTMNNDEQLLTQNYIAMVPIGTRKITGDFCSESVVCEVLPLVTYSRASRH